jgi:transcriptional regulator with XRE-family HTH domain
MDNPLDIEVRQALVQRRGQWPRIAEECDVSHSWISQFVRDKIPNPGFKTLTRLREYLGPPAPVDQASAEQPTTQEG